MRIFTEARAGRLVARVKNTVGLSTRKLGRQYSTSKDTISQELKRNGQKFRKRKKCLKYIPNQLARIPRCCRELRRIDFANDKIIVIDDEKYFTVSNSQMKGNDGFHL